MPKPSITEHEIALIKAMLARGMKNKDIQFLFNRPDRAVNSGRITGIKEGKYGISAKIAAANEEDISTFLEYSNSLGPVAGVKVPLVGKVPSAARGPVDLETLSAMFSKDAAGIWRLNVGETDQHECKLGFGFKHCGQWLKAIAALANNRGGYMMFGVHDQDDKPLSSLDKSYAVIGLDDDIFKSSDPSEFKKRIKSTLDPTPRFHIASFVIDGKLIGVIHVEQHPS